MMRVLAAGSTQSASSTAFQAVSLLRFAEEDARTTTPLDPPPLAEEGDCAKRGGGGSTGCDRSRPHRVGHPDSV